VRKWEVDDGAGAREEERERGEGGGQRDTQRDTNKTMEKQQQQKTKHVDMCTVRSEHTPNRANRIRLSKF
jgi:hypothetical protein